MNKEGTGTFRVTVQRMDGYEIKGNYHQADFVVGSCRWQLDSRSTGSSQASASIHIRPKGFNRK